MYWLYNCFKILSKIFDRWCAFKGLENVELYKNKKVSLGLGAKLAGATLSEFIDLLKEHNVFLNIEKALKTARKVFWRKLTR